eukprot:4198150-Lingulodinium_polyedra.AAC.1
MGIDAAVLYGTDIAPAERPQAGGGDQPDVCQTAPRAPDVHQPAAGAAPQSHAEDKQLGMHRHTARN